MEKRYSDNFQKMRNIQITKQKEDEENLQKINQTVPVSKKGTTVGFLKFHGFGISEIVPGLFLAGQDVAKNLQTLQKYQITHIINLTSNIENCFEKNFVYKRIKINDSSEQNILIYFNELIDFIDMALRCQEAKNMVLVHCNAGV